MPARGYHGMQGLELKAVYAGGIASEDGAVTLVSTQSTNNQDLRYPVFSHVPNLVLPPNIRPDILQGTVSVTHEN